MDQFWNLPNKIFDLDYFGGRQSSTNNADIEFQTFHRHSTRLRVNDFVGDVTNSRLQQMYT